jgi:hypothetical protein
MLGFHSGLLRASLVLRITPRGDVVSCLYEDPSERITIWLRR